MKRLIVDRELQMIKLKQRIEELQKKCEAAGKS